MAITVIIAPTVNAVSGVETRFTASGPFVLYGDGFAGDERCSLERLGPSGTYIKARSKKGMIKVGAYPNMVYVDAPGSYQLVKSTTRTAASVGIQSPHTLELFVNTDECLDLKMTEIFERPDTTGIWYDPQDLTTLYQDAQGTLPVYMPGTGQVDPPVGLMMDKSGGGYHAYQSTTTARPTLSGRYNLLTATETLATQSVTTAATTYTLSFSGEGTVTLSGTATGTYSAGTHTITCTAGTLTCTVDGSVTEADLRVKRDGSDLPAYQAVVDANNYDTEGFPLFLKRDMVDDNMLCQVPEGGITGAFSIGTVDGPVFGTRALPAGEAYPLWNDNATFGPSTYTQLINLNNVLASGDQEVFERFVYSRAKQLIDVDQFGEVPFFMDFFRSSVNYETALLTLDISNFDTRNARVFSQMFYNNRNLVIYGINALEVTSKATIINAIFFNNQKLTTIDISGWDLSSVINASNVSNGCSGLTDVIVGTAFDNTPCTNFTNAFLNTNLSQASIDKILISINNAGTSNGTFNQSGGSAPSAAGEAAITAMRSRGWTVTVTGGF